MTTIQTTAGTLAAGDRLIVAGAPFVVAAQVHGAWYLDCPRACFVEFELIEDATARLGTNGRSVLRLPKGTPVTIERSDARPT